MEAKHKTGQGGWFKNGDPFDFDYIFEQVVASGPTGRALLKSARQYKNLFSKSCKDFSQI
jgi:hypothetical protein